MGRTPIRAHRECIVKRASCDFKELRPLENAVHPFFYYQPRPDQSRALRIPWIRDETASHEIQMALLARGMAPGEPILNRPPPERLRAEPPPAEHLTVDLSFVRPEDVLLLTTRPPLDDREHGDRKQIEKAYTRIERVILHAVRPHLEVCARSHVKLAAGPRSALPERFQTRRDMAFRQGEGGFYKELNALDGRGWRRWRKRPRTAAFLLRVESLWPGGPGLLAAFGMDGTSTLVWAYRLRRDFAHLLDEPGFTMVEMTARPLPDRPTDLRFANDWRIEPVIEHLVA